MNHHFLDITRTSFMTCLRLLVGFQWYLCRAEIPSDEACTILPEWQALLGTRLTLTWGWYVVQTSACSEKTAWISSHMTCTGNFEVTSSQRLNRSKGVVNSARFVATSFGCVDVYTDLVTSWASVAETFSLPAGWKALMADADVSDLDTEWWTKEKARRSGKRWALEQSQ